MNNTEHWLEQFKFIKHLGEGGMGTAYLVEDLNQGGKQCVVKKIRNEYNDLSEQAEMIRIFQREASLLRQLNHPGIVRFLSEHSSEEGLYLVMEYVPGHTLDVLIKEKGTLSCNDVICIGIHCCGVLEYLHSFDPPILYRDLKPSNLILRTDGMVVFIDFGIARLFEPRDPATKIISSGYSPPEQYTGNPEPRGDLYSLGATMHYLLTGTRPKPVISCQPASINQKVIPELDSLIRQLTANKKDDRPSSARVVQHELLKLYKLLNPDFQMPDLDLEQQAENTLFDDSIGVTSALEVPLELLPTRLANEMLTDAGQLTSTDKKNNKPKARMLDLKNWNATIDGIKQNLIFKFLGWVNNNRVL